MRRLKGAAIGLLVAFFTGAGLRAAEINVYAAASLSESLKEAAAVYGKQSGDRIVFNFGASSALARQIEEGAPADVFVSADEVKMDALERNGRIIKGTRRSFLSNTLAIVVGADAPIVIRSAKDLAGADVARIALADPKTVPAGIYSKAYLEKLGIWHAVEPKVVPTDNVRAALAAVESGNVDAGIVYRTDAAISAEIRVAVDVPRAEGPDISYTMAVMEESRDPEPAKKFLAFLSSADAAAVFKKFGFIVRE